MESQAKELIKPGYYDAMLVDWKLDFIGKNQTPAAVLYFSLEDGAIEMQYKAFLTEKAKAKTVEDLVMLGLTDTDLVRFAQGKAQNALKLGKAVRVKIAHETYNGRIFERIRGVYEPKSRTQTSFDAIARAGTIKIGAEVLAAKSAGTKPEAKAVVSGGDDDLTF